MKNEREIINIESVNELHLLKNKDFRNMLQICLEDEEILKNNIKFFKKKIENLIWYVFLNNYTNFNQNQNKFNFPKDN